MRTLKKVIKKIWGNRAKNDDSRHISEIYRLEQSFLGLKMLKNKCLGLYMLKNKFLGLIFYFLGLKMLKNKV